jgi:hypothetical protein
MIDRLDDYLSGDMSDAEAEAFEEEQLFADGGAPPEAAFADALARIARYLAGRGTFHPGVTRAHVEALRAAGHRICVEHVRPGGPNVLVPPPPDVDFALTRIDVDLRGATRVDVEVEVIGGGPLKTFRDVVFDPEDGAIYALCERELAAIAFQVGATRTKVIAERDGVRETVAAFEVTPAG